MNTFFRLQAICLLGLLAALPVLAASGDDAAAFARARQYADNNQPREALKIYESLTESYPDNADYLTELGRTQLELKRALAATWSLKDAIDADPQKEAAYRLLINAYLQSGQSERAYEILQEARQQFGERPWMEEL